MIGPLAIDHVSVPTLVVALPSASCAVAANASGAASALSATLAGAIASAAARPATTSSEPVVVTPSVPWLAVRTPMPGVAKSTAAVAASIDGTEPVTPPSDHETATVSTTLPNASTDTA